MTGKELVEKNGSESQSKSFEELKQINSHGAEYWSARDLQPHLGYSQWRRFERAIERAITSCKQSGNEPGHHFAGAGKPITGGKGAVQVVPDYHLSRFACYLIAQNGDPRKEEIANAQKYFAIQTRRQELSDELAADRERLELRKQTAEEFKALSGAAQQSGVQSKMFGVFHDAGYKGLYGGMGRDAIKAHKQVGKEVRDAIKRIGGDLPESIPPAEHIKNVEKRVKEAVPKLELAEQDAVGLLGDGDDTHEDD